MEKVILMPLNMIGESLQVILKTGGAFNFKVTGFNGDLINGFDDEGLNLTIDIKDIDVAFKVG